MRTRDRKLRLCTQLGSVYAGQQFRGGVVLLATARHGVGGRSSDRCECKICDDRTASCFAGSRGGIDANMYISDSEIWGGRVFGFVCVCVMREVKR